MKNSLAFTIFILLFTTLSSVAPSFLSVASAGIPSHLESLCKKVDENPDDLETLKAIVEYTNQYLYPSVAKKYFPRFLDLFLKETAHRDWTEKEAILMENLGLYKDRAFPKTADIPMDLVNPGTVSTLTIKQAPQYLAYRALIQTHIEGKLEEKMKEWGIDVLSIGKTLNIQLGTEVFFRKKENGKLVFGKLFPPIYYDELVYDPDPLRKGLAEGNVKMILESLRSIDDRTGEPFLKSYAEEYFSIQIEFPYKGMYFNSSIDYHRVRNLFFDLEIYRAVELALPHLNSSEKQTASDLFYAMSGVFAKYRLELPVPKTNIPQTKSIPLRNLPKNIQEIVGLDNSQKSMQKIDPKFLEEKVREAEKTRHSKLTNETPKKESKETKNPKGRRPL